MRCARHAVEVRFRVALCDSSKRRQTRCLHVHSAAYPSPECIDTDNRWYALDRRELAGLERLCIRRLSLHLHARKGRARRLTDQRPKRAATLGRRSTRARLQPEERGASWRARTRFRGNSRASHCRSGSARSHRPGAGTDRSSLPVSTGKARAQRPNDLSPLEDRLQHRGRAPSISATGSYNTACPLVQGRSSTTSTRCASACFTSVPPPRKRFNVRSRLIRRGVSHPGGRSAERPSASKPSSFTHASSSGANLSSASSSTYLRPSDSAARAGCPSTSRHSSWWQTMESAPAPPSQEVVTKPAPASGTTKRKGRPLSYRGASSRTR